MRKEYTLDWSQSEVSLVYLLIQSGDVYMASELQCKQIAKSEQDSLPELYFCPISKLDGMEHVPIQWTEGMEFKGRKAQR